MASENFTSKIVGVVVAVIVVAAIAIPVMSEVKDFARENNLNLQDLVLWGGEDFELVITLPYFTYATMSHENFKYLGTVCEKETSEPVVKIITNDGDIIINEELFNNKSYNHFGG